MVAALEAKKFPTKELLQKFSTSKINIFGDSFNKLLYVFDYFKPTTEFYKNKNLRWEKLCTHFNIRQMFRIKEEKGIRKKWDSITAKLF